MCGSAVWTIRLLTGICSFISAGCGSDPQPAPTCTTEQIETCRVDQISCGLASGSAACEPCTVGEHAASSGNCEDVSGEPTTHAVEQTMMAPGGEILGMSWSTRSRRRRNKMCEALGLAKSPIAFESKIGEANLEGEDDRIKTVTRSFGLTAHSCGFRSRSAFRAGKSTTRGRCAKRRRRRTTSTGTRPLPFVTGMAAGFRRRSNGSTRPSAATSSGVSLGATAIPRSSTRCTTARAMAIHRAASQIC